MIKGPYIDPRVRHLTAHAVQRFAERHCAGGDVAEAAAKSANDAKPLYDQRWWLTTSYWINHKDRLLFIVKPDEGRLNVITVMRADSDTSLTNPQAAKALKQWRKANKISPTPQLMKGREPMTEIKPPECTCDPPCTPGTAGFIAKHGFVTSQNESFQEAMEICEKLFCGDDDEASDATIRVGDHALYPITSDDGQRMWASQPEGAATALDVVFDSDLALMARMVDDLATLQADCERWSGLYAKEADELVAVKARLAEVGLERDMEQQRAEAAETRVKELDKALRDLLRGRDVSWDAFGGHDWNQAVEQAITVLDATRTV